METNQAASYTISRGTSSDVEDVIPFIQSHWRENHVFTYQRELFEWQHLDERDDGLNFIIARDDVSQAILGILGYIDTALYDPALADERVLWLAIWVVDPGCKVTGLGIALRQHLQMNEPHQAMGTLGFSKKTALMYRAFKYEIGLLDRFYMVNREKEDFRLIKGFDGKFASRHVSNPARKLIPILPEAFEQFESELDFRTPADVLPRKSMPYFFNRYLQHPVYEYKLFGIQEAGQYLGLMAVRRAEGQGSAALRIVDYLGPDEGLLGLSAQFQELLEEFDCDYLDFYCLGIPEEIFSKAGLLKFDNSGSMILPNFFEPLEFQNVDINYAIKTALESPKFRFFKGDCDQDRPNNVDQINL